MNSEISNASLYWEISYSTTRILAESSDPNVAAGRILELLTRRLGWDFAAFWAVDDLTLVLRCTHFWNLRPGRFADFERVSYVRTFSIGEGLPGQSWKERRPLFVPDLRAHRNFPRASVARIENVVSALVFPLYSENRVLGAIEMFSSTAREAEPSVLEFCVALGGQIGMFLDRVHATETLRQAEAQFRMAAEKSFDAIVTIDETSTILYVNPAVERVFGYTVEELLGQKLMLVMPEYLRAVHEAGLQRYVRTGKRHLDWEGVSLTGLHRDGSEIPLEISFGEFTRNGRRVFTGFVRDCRVQRAARAV